jgi:hypothetical protein
MTTREALRQLVDELPESELDTAKQLLERLRIAGSDPILHASLNAPEDDEPLTPEELAAIEEGEAEAARGELVPWEEVKARRFRDS